MSQFHSLAVGHNGGDNPSTARERLAIKVISAAIDFQVLPPCFVKLTHGPKKIKTHNASGSTATFNFMCSMEIHPDISSLHVELLKGGGMLGGKTGLGSCEVVIENLSSCISCMDHAPADFPPQEMQLPLQGRTGETVPGKITVQIVRVRPPNPPYTVKALVGTWNVGNAPPAEELGTWLRPDKVAQAAVVVVGSQECQYDKRSQYKDNEDDWTGSIQAGIGETHTLLSMESIGQMRLGVWVRFDVIGGIHSFESGWEATGLGHVMTNKGGIATVIKVWDTTIAFVNSHLAAHQDKVKRRNEDYCEIAGGIYLGLPGCGLLNQFHHCIWMGDLNYRLDLSAEPDVGPEEANKKTPAKFLMDKIQALVDAKAYAKLLEYDQLIKARNQGEAYQGFQEGAITHPPTFKVERKQGIVYKDQRAPAYCDRVMWRSLPYMPGTCEGVWCGEHVSSSDHKPVGALLSLGMRPPRPDWWPRDGRHSLTGMSRKSVHEEYHSGLFSLKHYWHDVPELKSWHIQIVELAGADLHPADYNGKSDPYVAFLGDALMQHETTTVEYQTLNPTWAPTSLPAITLVATSEDSLKYEYIVVSCMDYDRIDADDAIGNGILAVKELLAGSSGGQVQAFSVDLAHAGLNRGTLTGKLKMTEGPPLHMEELIKSRQKKHSVGPKQAGCATLFGGKKEAAPHSAANSASHSKVKKATGPGTPAAAAAEEEDSD